MQCRKFLAPQANLSLPYHVALPDQEYLQNWDRTLVNTPSSYMKQHQNEYLTDDIRVDTLHSLIPAEPRVISHPIPHRSSSISIPSKEKEFLNSLNLWYHLHPRKLQGCFVLLLLLLHVLYSKPHLHDRYLGHHPWLLLTDLLRLHASDNLT